MVTAGHGSYAMMMEHYGKAMLGAIEEAREKLDALSGSGGGALLQPELLVLGELGQPRAPLGLLRGIRSGGDDALLVLVVSPDGSELLVHLRTLVEPHRGDWSARDAALRLEQDRPGVHRRIASQSVGRVVGERRTPESRRFAPTWSVLARAEGRYTPSADASGTRC
jgi:hypothetical protein